MWYLPFFPLVAKVSTCTPLESQETGSFPGRLTVLGALFTSILEDEILLRVWTEETLSAYITWQCFVLCINSLPDNLALVELARGSGESAWIVVGAFAAGSVSSTVTTVVCSLS